MILYIPIAIDIFCIGLELCIPFSLRLFKHPFGLLIRAIVFTFYMVNAASCGKDKSQIKIKIMTDHGAGADKAVKSGHDLLDCGTIGDHIICDVVDGGNICGNGFSGVHQRFKDFRSLAVFKAYGCKFNNFVTAFVQARCLSINDNKFIQIAAGCQACMLTFKCFTAVIRGGRKLFNCCAGYRGKRSGCLLYLLTALLGVFLLTQFHIGARFFCSSLLLCTFFGLSLLAL